VVGDRRELVWPRVRYADADGVSVAYEMRGDGPIDLVIVGGLMGSLVAKRLDPRVDAHLDRWAAFSRLICFDRRGQGLSDPVVSGPTPPLEQQVADIVAVMDDAGWRRAALFGGGDGGQVAILFAAMHPNRVRSLVLSNAFARAFRTEGYPIGASPVDRDVLARQMRAQWGDVENPWGLRMYAGNRLGEPGFRETFACVQQASASRAAAVAAAVSVLDSDVRDVLPLVQAPTLVSVAVDASREQREQAQFLVDHIPGARLVSFNATDSYVPEFSAEDWALYEEFLTGARSEPAIDRVLATVLFTDIVASTEQLAAVGDRRWREQLDRHDALVREFLEQFRGREIETAGDSFFATFDGPARAIRCAKAVIDGARSLGLDLRAGIHTGECEVRGDGFGGIAVHIGARVAALAGAGKVLTTSTVKDLVSGSGITFADHGTHTLKGVPEPWHLYEVT
jgi:class 3 adenylate cyclase